ESDDEENEGDERHEAESGRNAEPHRSALVRREDLGDLLTRQLELFANVGAHVLADPAEERAVTGPFVHGRDCTAHDTHARGGAGFLPAGAEMARRVATEATRKNQCRPPRPASLEATEQLRRRQMTVEQSELDREMVPIVDR